MSDPDLLVLASLAGGAKHGYAILEDVRAFAQVRLRPGTLYGAIPRLESEGLIEAVASVDRLQAYVITSKGTTYLEQRLRGFNAMDETGLRRLRYA